MTNPAVQLPLSTHPMALDIESQIRDMRRLQDFLLHHPDLPIAWVGGRVAHVDVPRPKGPDGEVLDWNAVDLLECARIVRMMKDGGKVEKATSEGYITYTRRFEGSAASIVMIVQRKAVCVRTVVGTEEVTIEAQPARTEVREIVEWDCLPLLAQAEEADET